MITWYVIHEQISEELNVPLYEGPKKNILKISKNVCNPSDSV